MFTTKINRTAGTEQVKRTLAIVVAAIACAVTASCSSDSGTSSAAATSAAATTKAASPTATAISRTPTRDQWLDMQDNMSQYAGWSFTVHGRVVTRDEQGATGVNARADIEPPASPAATKTASWGKPLWLLGNSSIFLNLSRGDVFTAVITISGASSIPNDPKGGYPVANVENVNVTGRAI